MIARAHQMVDVLTEENRMLRQEMDTCREKVTKLHKVTSSAEELHRIFSKSILACPHCKSLITIVVIHIHTDTLKAISK